MRLLFDQGTPVLLRYALVGHSVDTAYELGWSTLQNGELLDAAEQHAYEALIMTDQQLQDQQNLSSRRIAVVVASVDGLAPNSSSDWGHPAGAG